MKFGHFDDERREYVIDTPKTPLPWINYLGSEDFFSLISNTAGGYSFYRDARLRRIPRSRYNNSPLGMDGPCLLYTSDPAAEEDSVDLGSSSITKKKNKRGLKKVH